MSVENVRVPPDSTGKRVQVQHNIELAYSSGTIDFKIGDIVIGQSSGASGNVSQIEGTTASGDLYLAHNDGTPEGFTIGENLQVNAVTYAIVDTQIDFYTQNIVNVGQNNPFNGQYVDNQGAAYMRFAEGAPQFDAFGKMQVSQESLLGEYVHSYDEMPKEYLTTTNGGGSLSYEANSRAVLFSTGTTSGDKVERTTHKFHKYQPGVSHLVEFTVALGDAGKTNLNRWMGYGDADDGLFWYEENSTTYVVQRNSVTGSVVETRVAQADWNCDRLDGSGGTLNLSQVQLDTTKDNIFWIDFQLGAGRVRFGVIVNGVRIICHEFQNSNISSRPYMRTGTLPLHFGQENVGAVASSSEMRVWCCVVKTEGSFKPFEERLSFSLSDIAGSPSGGFVNINDVTKIPLMTLRPKQTFNGIDNRMWILPCSIQLYVVGDPILIDIVKDGTLTDATYDSFINSSSGMEIDTDATAISGGEDVCAHVITSDVPYTIDANRLFDYNKELIIRKANITEAFEYAIQARNLESGKSSQVFVTINWRELR